MKYVFILLSLLLVGCGGSRATMEKLRSIRIGETTEARMNEMFKKPYLCRTIREGETVTKICAYSWPYCEVETRNGVVIGYRYLYDQKLMDQWKWEDAKLNQLVVGQSTRDDVLQLLGTPTAHAVKPTKLPFFHDEFDTPQVAEVLAYGACTTRSNPTDKSDDYTFLYIRLNQEGKFLSMKSETRGND